ncbi:ACT domain-containing protein [Paraherbaspirillum soli]|uniref:ACT domain-containing protein n=1 Tax=Paraherbaspirillum soli TaxID=631222 RepID=A0ABW0MFH0_9BURK
MADSIRKADYFSMTVANKPGEGLKVLSMLAEKEVNLLAFTGFPRNRRAQLDFVPEDTKKFTVVAKKAGWEMSPKKVAFLVQGEDRAGALADALGKLAEAGINVTAMQATVGGAGRYGALFWVKPEDVAKSAKLLGAK